jgi:molecular chaperone GrpE
MTSNTPETPAPGASPQDTPESGAELGSALEQIQKLEEQLQAAAQERARLQDQLQRTLADMQNLRRHTQRQLDEGRQNTLTQLMAEFLPVLDNLERATRMSKSAEELQAGLRQVLSLFSGILDRRGITRIPAAGVPFDPKVHEAIAAEHRPDLLPDTVIEEIEPGYRLDQKVIRIARVKVNKIDAATATGA